MKDRFLAKSAKSFCETREVCTVEIWGFSQQELRVSTINPYASPQSDGGRIEPILLDDCYWGWATTRFTDRFVFFVFADEESHLRASICGYYATKGASQVEGQTLSFRRGSIFGSLVGAETYASQRIDVEIGPCVETNLPVGIDPYLHRQVSLHYHLVMYLVLRVRLNAHSRYEARDLAATLSAVCPLQ